MAHGQRLDGCVIVVDDIRIAAIGVQRQRTVGADKRGPNRTSRAGAFGSAETDRAHRQVCSRRINVRVVSQHVACRIAASRAVVDATRFRRSASVVHADWRVVDSVDGDIDRRGFGNAAGRHRIGEAGSAVVVRRWIECHHAVWLHSNLTAGDRDRRTSRVGCAIDRRDDGRSFEVVGAARFVQAGDDVKRDNRIFVGDDHVVDDIHHRGDGNGAAVDIGQRAIGR